MQQLQQQLQQWTKREAIFWATNRLGVIALLLEIPVILLFNLSMNTLNFESFSAKALGIANFTLWFGSVALIIIGFIGLEWTRLKKESIEHQIKRWKQANE